MRLIGIDLGVHKIAIAVLEGEDLIHAARFEAPAKDPRDEQLSAVAGFAAGVVAMHQPDAVWIEDIIVGNNRKYSIGLAQNQGAVMTTLSSFRYSASMDIRVVDNKAWKKQVVGNGNADKNAVKNYIHEVHPAYAPFCDGDQDLYDAVCVGLYGLQITDRAQHLQL